MIRNTGNSAARRRAVFIDRDGTLNVHAGYVLRPDQLDVYDFAGKAVRRLNDAGWLVILVTNQGVLARGRCSPDTMTAIHDKLAAVLALDGARLDALQICPHHPSVPVTDSADGQCACRKPRPGLLLQASAAYDIDLAASWTIGDSTSDVAAGIAAGTRTILVGTGLAGQDGLCQVLPDFVVDDVRSAVDLILS